MATREELVKEAEHLHSACGCKSSKQEEPQNCPTITCGSCEPQTIQIKRKTSRRICVDFSSCEWCETDCHGKYFLLGLPCFEDRNPHSSVNDGGQFGLSYMHMDQETGKLYLNIDAFDSRLNFGEIRLATWHVQGPDMTRKFIEFYLCAK